MQRTGKLFEQAQVHYNMPFDEYCTLQGINASALKGDGATSPKHLKAVLDGEIVSEDSNDKRLGRAIHCSILEPDRFETAFPVATPCQATLKSGANAGSDCGSKSSFRSEIGLGVDLQREQAHHLLISAGFRVTAESEHESVYYAREKETVRISDHPPNEDTQKWMEDVRCLDLRITEKSVPSALVPTLRPLVGDIAPLLFWYCGKHCPSGSEEVADLVTAEERHRLVLQKESLQKSNACEYLRRSPGYSEAVITFSQLGYDMKTRIDRLCVQGDPKNPDLITEIDFKKCRVGNATWEACQNECLKRGYHIASWFHVAAIVAAFDVPISKVESYILFVEDGPPFDTHLLKVSDMDLKIADTEIVRQLSRFRRCQQTGIYDGCQPYINPDKEGVLPQWFVKRWQMLQAAGS